MSEKVSVAFFEWRKPFLRKYLACKRSFTHERCLPDSKDADCQKCKKEGLKVEDLKKYDTGRA